MGGKSKSVTTGLRYHVAFHHGLAATPIDALLEIRCADKTAWTGEQTANGTITINQPQLFGGDKDQGGIVGDMDVMLGKPGQQPNGYLTATFGPQQPAWLGVTTVAWKGGQWGSNNPYPQAPAYKIRSIKMGWDGDPGDGSACWYPEKAAVPSAMFGAGAPASLSWDLYATPTGDVDYARSSPTSSSFSVGSIGGTALLRARAAGTVEQMPYTGGTAIAAHVYSGGHAAESTYNIYRLDISSPPQTFFLNSFPSVGEPVAVDNEFSFTVNDNATVTLSWDAQDGKMRGSNQTLTLGSAGVGDGMNAAHILYDLLTSQDRGAEPVASISDASFRAAADWFYAQGIGLCTQYDPDSETVAQAIARIEKVAGCSVSRDPTDGLWYLDIANGVYDLASLPVLTDDDILDFSESPSILDDVVNSVSVEYVDVGQHLTMTTPPLQCLALINSAGLNSQTNQYHEAPTAALAARFAQRDLQNGITPKHAFDLTCTRKPYAWRINTYFRLQSTKRGIADMVCLLAEKSSGTLKSGAIKITAVEDVYSLPASSFVQAEPGVDTRPPQIPIAITAQAAFEAPWTTVCAAFSAADLGALSDDAAFVLACAAAPGDYPDYVLTLSADGGATYAEIATEQWCPTAEIIEGDALAGAPATSFTLASGAGLGSIVVGSAALWGSEIVRVDAIDATAVPPTLTLGRGCADTIPVAHAADERIWFYDDHAAADPTQYSAGETVQAKLLTESGSARLDAAQATAIPVMLAGRAWLPYPPAGLKIGGQWFPATASGTVAVTWAERNRSTQADQLVDTLAGTVTPAADVRYHLRLADANDATLAERTDLAGTSASFVLDYTGDVTLTLAAISDAGESLQRWSRVFAYTPPSGSVTSAITGTAYNPQVPTWNLDGNLGT